MEVIPRNEGSRYEEHEIKITMWEGGISSTNFVFYVKYAKLINYKGGGVFYTNVAMCRKCMRLITLHTLEEYHDFCTQQRDPMTAQLHLQAGIVWIISGIKIAKEEDHI